MTNNHNWNNIVSVQVVHRPDTWLMFRENASDPQISPIDSFIKNTNIINTLYFSSIGPEDQISPELGSLVLLGYMSAVESYFRAMLRRCIQIDPSTKKAVEMMTIPYGAAVHHEPGLLPEALFEGISFAGKKGAIDFVKSVLGIKGHLPSEVETTLSFFLSICEIRHCCVHRFGKLGSQNAFRLGSEQHADLIEKPFEPTIDDLQNISDILRTFVKTINNWVWTELLNRTVSSSTNTFGTLPWEWRWSNDENIFKNYYCLFCSLEDSPPSRSMFDIYVDFATHCGPSGAPFPDEEEEEEEETD